jgi:polyhydroxyalkanoate synthesis repressor PhaR
LSDVKDLVLSRENFNVLDAKGPAKTLPAVSCCRSSLRKRAAGVPLFTTDLLAQMIRFYGHAMQGMLGKYLETNMKSFVDFQKKLQEPVAAALRRKQQPDDAERHVVAVHELPGSGDADDDGHLYGAEPEDAPPDAGPIENSDAHLVHQSTASRFSH